MSDPVETMVVGRDEHHLRLDRWFKHHFPELTYGHLQKLLRSGQIRVDSKRAQSNTRLTPGQRIRVPRAVREPNKQKPSLKPAPGASKADRRFIEDLVLFEDDAVLVLNKPFGIAVQGGTGTRRHIDGLLAGMIDRFGARPRLVTVLTAIQQAFCWSPKHAMRQPSWGGLFKRDQLPRPIGRWS
ncbi:MAG: hypothetical protein AAFR90_08840 [Pseudomonadota bacterium]